MTVDKQIKREARALVAAGEAGSYQEALYRLAPALGAVQLTQQAGGVDLDKVARDLAAVWAQGKTVGPWPYDRWEDPNYNQCGCGGEDDYDGQLYCACGNGCSCPSCEHEKHRRAAKCQLAEPTPEQPYAWCAKPTRFRVVPVCIHRGGVYRQASDGDPEADETGSTYLGDSVQRDTWTSLYACSTQHAREIIAERRARDGRRPEDSRSTEWFYEVERYRYKPDEFDVQTPLHHVAEHARSAQYWAEEAIKALHDGNTDRARSETESTLNYLAWAVGRAVQIGQKPAEDEE